MTRAQPCPPSTDETRITESELSFLGGGLAFGRNARGMRHYQLRQVVCRSSSEHAHGAGKIPVIEEGLVAGPVSRRRHCPVGRDWYDAFAPHGIDGNGPC